MQSILTVVFVSSLMVCARAQTWNGIYTVDPGVCDGTQCCCFNGLLTLTQPSASVLRVNSALNGTQCGGTSVFSYEGVYPGGYVTSLGDGSGAIGVTLSADSRTIVAVNPLNATCNGRAVRVGSVPVTSTKATSGTEKLAISSMSMVAGILLAAINRMAH